MFPARGRLCSKSADILDASDHTVQSYLRIAISDRASSKISLHRPAIVQIEEIKLPRTDTLQDFDGLSD